MDTEISNQWAEKGYVVARRVFTAQRTAQLRDICDRILDQWRQKNPETGQPGGDICPETGQYNGGGNVTSMRHLNHSGYFYKDTKEFVELMEAIADPALLNLSSSILGEIPLFRSTTLFMNPLEKSWDGNWHRDTQFLCADEEEEKTFIADRDRSGIQFQVALVASDAVQVVPGSHLRWDTPKEYAIRRADGGANRHANDMPGAVRVALEPGDAVAFNAYGLHRGQYRADKLRRTLMMTYTRTSRPLFDYFSNQPWFDEPGHLEGLDAATQAFFESFIAEYGPQWRKSEQVVGKDT